MDDVVVANLAAIACFSFAFVAGWYGIDALVEWYNNRGDDDVS